MTVFEDILRRIQADKADLILHTGDIVKRCKAGQYAWVLHELGEEGLTIPFCAVAGNHDINEEASEIRRRYSLYSRSLGLRRYWFSYGQALFVAFDDATDRATPEVLQWLDETLTPHSGQYPPSNRAPLNCLPCSASPASAPSSPAISTATWRTTWTACPSTYPGGAGGDLDMPQEGHHYLLCSVSKDSTFHVQKVTVTTPEDSDVPEYLLFTKFPEDLGVSLGAALLATGILSALAGRRLRRLAPQAA